MTLAFRVTRRMPPRLRRLDSSVSRAVGVVRPPRPLIERRRWLAGCLGIAFAVLAFSRAWQGGSLVLDGPGASLWVRMALDHWSQGGIPYWVSTMWAGTPGWGLAPTFPVLSVLPLAALVGAEEAVKLAAIAGQVAGGLGAAVLARSLWHKKGPALAAGAIYALHPLLVADLALDGHQPSGWVIAATPWLVWALVAALRGHGRRWVAGAGLLAGFSVLEQPEHVYGLALLAGCLLVVELARARATGVPRAAQRVCGRAAVIGVIAGGLSAYWTLPFRSLSDAFVLTPPNLARQALVKGIGSVLGQNPGLFLNRASVPRGPVSFSRLDFFSAGSFYLSAVCLALVGITLLVLARRPAGRPGPSGAADGTLSAVLFASAVGIWTSLGGVALASSRLRSSGVVPFLVVGLVAGLVTGGFLRRLCSGRWAVVAGVAAAGLLVGVPYVAPFLGLREVVPLLKAVRFPRLYPVAVLGLALGAAYPLTLLHTWAMRRSPLGPLLTAAVTLAVLGAFLADTQPYRSFYRVHPPDASAAYARVSQELSAAGDDSRVASATEPGTISSLLATGRQLTTGWPYPAASKDVWRLSFEPLSGTPIGFRDGALALSSTRYLATVADRPAGLGPGPDTEVALTRIPRVLPRVRAYEQVLVVRDRAVAPELAVALASRNVGVVTGGPAADDALGRAERAVVGRPQACSQPAADLRGRTGRDAALTAELVSACSMHRWVGVVDQLNTVVADGATGGVFEAPVDGLRGLSVWFDRPAELVDLTVREVGPDGRSLGRALTTSRSTGYDANEMAYFPIDPTAVQTGHRYVFLLSCAGCTPGQEPRMVRASATRGAGDLVAGGQLQPDRVAAFSMGYDRVEQAAPPDTVLRPTNESSGRWSIDVTAPRPALVVVADAWFPGWQARVDGRPAQVLEADGAFVGVPVRPGHHRVTLAYRPPSSLLAGKVVSVVTLIGSLAMLAWKGPVWSRRSRRSRLSRRFRQLRRPLWLRGPRRGRPQPLEEGAT